GVHSQALRSGRLCEAVCKSALKHPYPTIQVCETGVLDVASLGNPGCGKELATLVARCDERIECSRQCLSGFRRVDEHERAAEPQCQPRRLRDVGLRQTCDR